MATWCKELTHCKRPWFWERLKAGEGDDREFDGWMASLTQWTWVWVNSNSWPWTGRLVCCSPWRCQNSDTTERLKWTELILLSGKLSSFSLLSMMLDVVSINAIYHIGRNGNIWSGKNIQTTNMSILFLHIIVFLWPWCWEQGTIYLKQIASACHNTFWEKCNFENKGEAQKFFRVLQLTCQTLFLYSLMWTEYYHFVFFSISSIRKL